MNLLINKAVILDPSSPYQGKKMDILIENGIIRAIKSSIQSEKNSKIVSADNLHVSAGWMDMQVDLCDPGYEFKEDLASGTAAAAKGGFTAIAVVPSTLPTLSSKSQIEYLKNKAAGNLVDVYPLGSITNKLEGNELAEMYDMHRSGAIGFSDDKNALSNAGVLLRALQYAQNFNGLILSFCKEKNLSLDGQMNEGEQSTRLGLKGMPGIAEEIMVSRNLFLAEYVGAPIHISSISTKRSAELIRQAKAKGLPVTCSVNSYNLVLTDSALAGFDSNYKLDPPLRTKTDVDALKKALLDGTIDAVCSDHRPQDIESKELEYDHAAFGMIGLETSFAMLNSNRGKLTLEQLVQSMSANPRAIFGLPKVTIAEGAAANLTLFDPTREWTYSQAATASKSANSPFDGAKFTGKVIGVVNKNNCQLFNS